MKNKLLLLSFLVCVLSVAMAQDAHFYLKNGVRITMPLEEVDSITYLKPVRSIVFSPNKITCTLYGNTTIDNVRTLTFWDVVFTAIENTPATSTIRVYPNPTASMLVIEGATGNGTMDVYNINGTLLLSEPIQEGVNTIQVSNLAKGLYILKLPNDTFKFTKQ